MKPRIVPDPRQDPDAIDRAHRESKRARGHLRATPAQSDWTGARATTVAEALANKAREIRRMCSVEGCNLTAADRLCKQHQRAKIARRSMLEHEPMRDGLCNAPLSPGARPRGRRCSNVPREGERRCQFHRGVVLENETNQENAT